MLIGKDFEKIKIEVFDLILLEPNAMLGDLLIFILAIYYARKVKVFQNQTPFFSYWRMFFLTFGITFLIGGFTHLFYYYLGHNSKYIIWYLGFLNAYFIEMAMTSVFPDQKIRNMLTKIVQFKLIAVMILATYIYTKIDISVDQNAGLLVPTLNSTVGLFFALGVLGIYYSRKIHNSFAYFCSSVFILTPSIFFQSMKINLHQWFDRNDASHVLLLLSLLFYFKGVKGYNRSVIESELKHSDV